ncbi:MAG: XRE family transcriptional regulator, partial [bacterium]
DYSDKDMDKEQEADKFACKWTLTEDEEAEILATAHLSKQDIRDFAKQFTTHPAIIIGRLQHKKVIPYSLGREYFEPIIFD